jgi:hypothetical protein
MNQRELEPKLKKLVTFSRRRPLRPKELAQTTVNVARRYPHRHNQSVECGSDNRACLVGWCAAILMHHEPAKVTAAPNIIKLRWLKESNEADDWLHFDVVEVVAGQLRIDVFELDERVYSESDPDRAIANFCELTGAVDPGRQAGSAA